MGALVKPSRSLRTWRLPHRLETCYSRHVAFGNVMRSLAINGEGLTRAEMGEIMKWAKSYGKSRQRRKQRIYRFKAPLHIKQKFVHASLSKELRKKYSKRSIGIRKGDKVKIAYGQFKGKTGTVERVDLKRTGVFVSGIERLKKDGSKSLYPLNPSSMVITELQLDDKMRQKKVMKHG